MAQPTNPTYNGSDGGRIDLTTARQWVKNFRDANQSPSEIVSHYYGRNTLDQILSQPGCTGIRVFYGINDSQEKELLVVGVDNKGNNMLPASPVVVPGDNSVMDNSYPCPPFCPPGETL